MKHLLTILMICLATNLFSATIPTTGIVMDAKTREPLAFANIVVVGQQRGSVSNAEGYFVLNMDSIAPTDTILFSYMGYETQKIPAAKLKKRTKILLKQATLDIREVEVMYKSLSAKEIVALVRRNYDKNHPSPSSKQQIFFHKYGKVPFPEDNQITLIKSDFAGLDEQTVYEVLEMMPREFIEYQDAVVDLYKNGKNHRLLPREGVSLEEQSMLTTWYTEHAVAFIE